jgi:serine/threonine protein kinase
VTDPKDSPEPSIQHLTEDMTIGGPLSVFGLAPRLADFGDQPPGFDDDASSEISDLEVTSGAREIMRAARLGLPQDPEQSLQPDRTISTVQQLQGTSIFGPQGEATPPAIPAEQASAEQVFLDSLTGIYHEDVTLGSSQGVPGPMGSMVPETLPAGRSTSVNPNETVVKPDPLQLPHTPSTSSGPLIFREFLAAGGFGEVWSGEQTSLGRTVAVKKIKESLLQDCPDPSMKKTIEDLFRYEATITAGLEHPNIVPVYDIGKDEHGRPVLAMKLVRGETWRDNLRREFDAKSPADFLTRHIPILVQVTQAVAFAHGLGIVHRDLKPSQVMLGDYGEVLLMDWGLAMKIDHGKTPPPLPTKLKPANRRSGLSGTLAYMAPEQAAGEIHLIGCWTDIFLLGAMLYELLTGGPPYRAPNSLEVLNLASAGRVEPPSERAKKRSIPRDLERIAMKAMARNPAERYPSAKDFLAALEDWLTGAGRRRESQELVLRASETLESAGRSYAFITVAISQLTNAQVLWNENPEIPPLLNKAHGQFAMAAIENGDLTLGRLQAGLVEEPTIRAGLLAKVELAQRAARAKARQRSILMMVSLVLALGLVGGAFYFTTDQVRAARELQTSNSRMSLQMEKASAASEQAEELLTFLLEDLRPRLEPTGQLDVLEGVGQQALRYFETLDWQQQTTRGLQRRIQALNQIAAVQLIQGNKVEALDAAYSATSLAAQLSSVVLSPTPTMIVTVGAAYSLRGRIYQTLQQETSSTLDLEQARTIFEKLPQLATSHPDFPVEYALVILAQADQLTETGAWNQIRTLTTRAKEIISTEAGRLSRAQPTGPTEHSLGRLHLPLALAQVRLHLWDEASSTLQAGLSSLQRAHLLNTSQFTIRQDLFQLLALKAQSLLFVGEPAEISSTIEQLQSLAQSLYQQNPTLPKNQLNLAQARSILAEWQLLSAPPNTALTTLHSIEADKLLEETIYQDTNFANGRVLAVLNESMARAYALHGQTTDSLMATDRALSHWNLTHQSTQPAILDRLGLARAQILQFEVRQQTLHQQPSEEDWRPILENLDELASLSPETRAVEEFRIRALLGLSATWNAKGDPTRSRSHARMALNRLEDLLRTIQASTGNADPLTIIPLPPDRSLAWLLHRAYLSNGLTEEAQKLAAELREKNPTPQYQSSFFYPLPI